MAIWGASEEKVRSPKSVFVLGMWREYSLITANKAKNDTVLSKIQTKTTTKCNQSNLIIIWHSNESRNENSAIS